MVWTQSVFGATVDDKKKYIRTFATNNNRVGPDYIVADFVNAASGGLRAMFRIGYMAGRCCCGWLYVSAEANLIQKSGTCYHSTPYRLPESDAVRVESAMKEMGVDYAHFEGCYVGNKLYIFDINAHPNTAGGSLTYTTQSMVKQLVNAYLR
jgi:hypothetical protein